MNNYIVRISTGIAISVLLTLILLFIFSIILAYTNTSESVIIPVIIGITGISILSGSSIATSKIKKKGIANGMIVGGIYIFILYLISSILNASFSLNMHSIVMIIIGIIAGAIGGIVGVNFRVGAISNRPCKKRIYINVNKIRLARNSKPFTNSLK